MSGTAYARLVPKIHRSKKLPKIDRPWRPHMIAWAGPAAFYPNRFYEQDKWYKARIDKPEKIPKLHIIDPTQHDYSLSSLMEKDDDDVINIGFKRNVRQQDSVKTVEERSELEKKSRKMQLLIDESIASTECSLPIYHHYNIFSDLFGKGVFFENTQMLDVSFGDNAVYNGNVIAACDTTASPKIEIESVSAGGFNTLVMVNLDGNVFEKEGELVNWMVTNIPDGARIDEGDEVTPYMQPLPFSGTGFHRVAFVLFRHSQTIDVQKLQSLESRVCSISRFYKQHEAAITPSALCFFQTTYDSSVKDQLHSLGLKSPIYQYEYNEALRPAQKEFPLKAQPFDLYLDMFRDPKTVENDLLEERLQKAQLEDYQAPEIIDMNYNENKRDLPAWQHKRMLRRDGKYTSLYDNAIRE